jgi:hypothetical protein
MLKITYVEANTNDSIQTLSDEVKDEDDVHSLKMTTAASIWCNLNDEMCWTCSLSFFVFQMGTSGSTGSGGNASQWRGEGEFP